MDAANKSTSKSAKSTGSKDGEISDDQDQYCWLCHKEKCNLSCQICPRSYHLKCINNNPPYAQLDSFALLNDKSTFIKDDWVCFECEIIARAESDEGKSACMRRINKDQFNELLDYALVMIKKSADVTFHTPVNLELYQDYSTFIVHPMDFFKIEQYVKTRKYSSTEAFLSDCKWILHNCYIYNQATNPLTFNARTALKVAKNQMYEIETCPDCFKNQFAYPAKDFFVQTCSYPHNLVLAKLKGHPMWPSKVVKYNELTKEAEVRFFGTPHDKAWCSLNNCLMLNEIPGTGKVNKNQRNKLEAAINELKTHLELLNERFPNLFQFSPPKTTLTPDKVYLIPLPEAVTAPLTPSSISSSSAPSKDASIVSESLASENSENISQPARKQQKTATPAPAKTSAGSKAPQKGKPAADEDSVSNENDQSSLNEDSDDDIDHKLVIDDESLNSTDKKRPPKRKHQDSSSSNKLPATNKSLAANQSVQKRKLSAVESPQLNLKNESLLKEASPVLPKKKLKKGANDSANSSSFLAQNYQQQKQTPFATEKEQQFFKQIQYYKDELERSRAIHISEIKEMFENHKSEFRDLKISMEAEKTKALASLHKELESKHAKEIEEVKRKSWCVQCLKQASYFCCRLASYCSYECQSEHWATHMSTCAQSREAPAAATTTTASAAPNQESPAENQVPSKEENPSEDEPGRESAKEKEKKSEQQSESANEPKATESVKESVIKPAETGESVSLPVEKVEEKTEEKPAKSPVKKIKQIIKEKNEQQNKNESTKLIEPAAEAEVESSRSEKEPIEQVKEPEKLIAEKEKKPAAEESILKKPVPEEPVAEQVTTKKPIAETAVEQPIEQAPGKPKDRFLKKLNEDKSNLTAEPIQHQSAALLRKAVDDKSNSKTEPDKVAKSGESIDKQVDTSVSAKEVSENKMKVDEIDGKKEAESKVEKKNLSEEPLDELARMRQQLVQKLLENKKRKELLAATKGDSNADEQRKQPAQEKPPAEAPVKVRDSSDSKRNVAPISQFSLERRVDVNLSEESDEEEEKPEDGARLEEAKGLKQPFHQGDLDDIDDDSNLMDELISEAPKKDERTEETGKDASSGDRVSAKQHRDSSSAKDQLTNQRDNEEISSSHAAPGESPIHSEVNSVKEDLISKVENELKG